MEGETVIFLNIKISDLTWIAAAIKEGENGYIVILLFFIIFLILILRNIVPKLLIYILVVAFIATAIIGWIRIDKIIRTEYLKHLLVKMLQDEKPGEDKPASPADSTESELLDQSNKISDSENVADNKNETSTLDIHSGISSHLKSNLYFDMKNIISKIKEIRDFNNFTPRRLQSDELADYLNVDDSYFERLEIDCIDDTKFQSIAAFRLALYILLSEDKGLQDKYVPEQSKRPNGYYDELIKNRQKDDINRILRENEQSFQTDVSREDYSDYGLGTLIYELLEYYDKIVKHPNWEIHFQEINRELYLKGGTVFYNHGFERPQNECYYLSLSWAYDVSIDAWLYSFWLRRYNEGTMARCYNFLRIIR